MTGLRIYTQCPECGDDFCAIFDPHDHAFKPLIGNDTKEVCTCVSDALDQFFSRHTAEDATTAFDRTVVPVAARLTAAANAAAVQVLTGFFVRHHRQIALDIT